jgi:glycosyltransferase involved in cell wall biosynthesis
LKILAPLPCKVALIGPPDDGYPGYAAAVDDFVARSDKAFWIKGLPPGSALLASAYAASRCHVLWSDGETAGLVSIEALAAGTIAVSRPHRTVREMLGMHGVYPNDGSALRQAVENIYDLSDAQRSTRVRSARDYALSTFSWESVAGQTVELYKKLLSSENAG